TCWRSLSGTAAPSARSCANSCAFCKEWRPRAAIPSALHRKGTITDNKGIPNHRSFSMKKVMLLFFSAVFCFALACGAVGAAAEEAIAPACKAAYLCDWRSGTAVYEKEADRHLPIASMCKIMTLLLCFEEAD